MADAELHIHINHPVDMTKLNELLQAAINAKDDGEAKIVVPTGYRCASCFRDDGGHDVSCPVYAQQKRQAERAGV
jgi:hypothetical protein